MAVLLSKRVLRGMDGVVALPTASEEAFECDEHQNGEEAATGKESAPIAAAVAVVSVRTEVRAAKMVGVPDGAEEDAQDDRDCDEDEDG
jgi:hypothetical protein